MKNLSPSQVSEMLAEIRKAEARRLLIRNDRQLNAARTPAERCALEAKHAAMVADYRRLPSVTSPGSSVPQE
jgi:hypothetical protein